MSFLKKVTKGRVIKPLAFLVHAMHGLGKTKLASEAPKPIFVGAEENDEIEAARMPKIEKWNELKAQLKELLTEDHDYKTLVIDTLDGLEEIAQRQILTGKNATKTMATAYGGYGKAYDKMRDMFMEIKNDYIIPLRDKKRMNIIILCHSKESEHTDPMTTLPYIRYSPATHKKVGPLFNDWVSAILFINYQIVVSEDGGIEKAEQLDDSRAIYTAERLSQVAKNRFNLPYEIEFKEDGTFKEVSDLIREHYKKQS